MNYIEQKKQYLSKFVTVNDGVHNHVFNIKNSNDNVLGSIKKYGYVVEHNDKATLYLKNSTNKFKLDSRANNATSSSMLSASFFAYLTENPNYFDCFIKKIIGGDVESFDNKKVITEYRDTYGDKSVIDAYITFEINGIKYSIYIETKYLESAYGKKNKFHNKNQPKQEQEVNKNKYVLHTKEKFKYHKNILNIDDYLDEKIESFDEIYKTKYVQYYQIIRNVSHASKKENRYVVFLLDKNNNSACQDIKNGIESLKNDNKDLVVQRVKIAYFTDFDFLPEDMKEKYFY